MVTIILIIMMLVTLSIGNHVGLGFRFTLHIFSGKTPC